MNSSAQARSGLYDLRLQKAKTLRGTVGLLSAAVATATMLVVTAAAQQPSSTSNQVTIRGTVLGPDKKPVNDAVVRLESEGSTEGVVARSNADGVFVFLSISAGNYHLSADNARLRSPSILVHATPATDARNIELLLQASGPPSLSGSFSTQDAQTMQFADEPNFSVAGVTDWTAVGGHGSDATLRTSESLASATLALKPENATQDKIGARRNVIEAETSEHKLRKDLAAAPQSFSANSELGAYYLRAGRYSEAISFLESAYRINPANTDNQFELAEAYEGNNPSQARTQIGNLSGYAKNADLHRLMGDLNEKQGDPLAAVQNYEQAVTLDPSEENYFKWGSEMLLHRAVWQAQEVLRKGADLYPQSMRMETALGASLFAGARYDEAALRLCHASDLDPADPTPYIFMGKIQIASPNPLPCIEAKLARFLKLQPESSTANYLNAMTILKQQEQSPDKEAVQQAVTLLTKAVTVDPKCSEAYLQLGIISASERSFDEAIDFYAKAIEADPQLADAYYRLGVAYDRTGQLTRAKQEFQLHDRIKQQQAKETDQQRREVKQFLFAKPDGIASSPVQ